MMDEPQKKARQAKIREVVRNSDITRWISLQLQDLRELID
jgi:trehalose-6-phosphate synthase